MAEQQRECIVCPDEDYVARCSHWDGNILVLIRGGTICRETGRPHPSNGYVPFAVLSVVGWGIAPMVHWGSRTFRRSCNCRAGLGPSEEQYFEDYGEAEDEFYRREAELLTT